MLSPEIFLAVFFLAFIMEMIDAGLGMGYGTILSPLLMAFGLPPLLVVPSLLISQAIGGLTATVFHQINKNVDFRPKTTNISLIKQKLRQLGYIECFKRGFSRDFKIVFVIAVLGILATIFGAIVAVKIPTWLLTAYIGGLVLLIGILIVLRRTFSFSWKKITFIGILAAFNKGISGGGFGPLTTGGQVIAGNRGKNSIGCTTFAEAPICIAGFIVYMLTRGISSYSLLIALCLGAFAGAPFGTFITQKSNTSKLRFIIGILIIFEGAYTLSKLVF